jgi:hypothetical protein
VPFCSDSVGAQTYAFLIMEHHPIWLPLAEQASKETDPAKMIQLVEQLCHAIDVQRNRKDRAQ